MKQELIKEIISELTSDKYMHYGKKHIDIIHGKLISLFPDLVSKTDCNWFDYCNQVFFFFTGRNIETDIQDTEQVKKNAAESIINQLLLQIEPKAIKQNDIVVEVVPVITPVEQAKDICFIENNFYEKSEVLQGNEVISEKDHTGKFTIKTSNKHGELEYSCGMVINFGAGHTTKFNVSLALPCNLDTKDNTLFIAKSFCDLRIREEYKYVSSYPVTVTNTNDLFSKFICSSLKEDEIFLVSFSKSNTISMPAYESCKIGLSLKVYTSMNNIDKTYYEIREWVLKNIQKTSKEVISKIDSYVERRQKKTF